MPGMALQVVLQAAMAFDGDHRRGLVFTRLERFTPGPTMRQSRHRQSQGTTRRPGQTLETRNRRRDNH